MEAVYEKVLPTPALRGDDSVKTTVEPETLTLETVVGYPPVFAIEN